MGNDRKKTSLHTKAHPKDWLAILVEGANDGMVVLQDNKCLYMNNRLIEMLGRAQDINRNKPFDDFFHPDERSKLNAYLEKQSKRIQKHPLLFETILKDKQDSDRFVELNASAYHSEDNNLLLVIIRDVDKRKRADLALQKRFERYRQCVDYSPNPIFTVEKHGKIQKWNDACETYFGYKRDAVLGQSIQNILWDDEERRAVHKRIQRVYRKEYISNVDVVFKTENGQKRFTLSRLFPIIDEVNHVEACVFANTDMTRHKLTEERLRENEKRYRRLFELSPAGIIIEDENGIIVDVNEAICESLHSSPEQLIGKDIREVSGAPIRVVDEHIAQILEGHNLHHEVKNRLKDGSECFMELYETRITLSDGRQGVLAISNDVTRRKQVEQSLRDSEERNRLLIQNAPLGIFLMDEAGYLELVNPALVNILGSPSEEATKAVNLLTFPRLVEAGISEAIKKCLESGEPYNGEFHYQSKWGKAVDCRLYLNPTFNNPGECAGVQGIVADITMQKKVQDSLRISEEKYRELVENLNDVIFIVDNKGSITYINSVIEQLSGYKAEEVIGHSFSEYIHPDDQKMLQESFERTLKGDTHPKEYRILGKDGQIRWMRSSSKPIFEKDRLVGVRGLMSDITSQKSYEAALKESEEKYRRLIEYSNDAIYLLYNQRFELVNRRFLELFELSQEDVNKEHFSMYQLISDKSRDMIKVRQQKFENGESLDHSYAFIGVTKSGKEIHIEASVAYFNYRNGKAVQGILRDVTEKKRLEEQLFQSQKMEAIGFLAGGVAHDFNNLLTVINGHAELARMKIENQQIERISKDIHAIEQAGKSAVSVTSQLLAFSRRQIYEPEVLNINAQIQKSLKMLSRLIGEDVKIEQNFQDHLPNIMADPGQIDQIMMNLFVNARDALAAVEDKNFTKKIMLETALANLDDAFTNSHPGSVKGTHIKISIGDNGIGMDEETRGRIFEPFFSVKEKGKGTGLGLSTVYGIIKQNKANIYVESKEGRGATFHIYWPVVNAALKSDDAKINTSRNLYGTETILLVEDSRGVRDFVSNSLKSFGYTILQAPNGKEALSVFMENTNQIGMIITDVVMPGEDGKQLVSKLHEVNPHLPVIYISGYTDDKIVNLGALNRDVNFLQKPFSVETLAAKVRTTLDSKMDKDSNDVEKGG